MHAVLQTADLATGEGIPQRSRAQAAAEDVLDHEHEIARLCRVAVESDVVRRAVASQRYWREVPVAIGMGSGSLHGFIDLLFEEPDGLVVVDYQDRLNPRRRDRGGCPALPPAGWRLRPRNPAAYRKARQGDSFPLPPLPHRGAAPRPCRCNAGRPIGSRVTSGSHNGVGNSDSKILDSRQPTALFPRRATPQGGEGQPDADYSHRHNGDYSIQQRLPIPSHVDQRAKRRQNVRYRVVVGRG